MNSSSRRSSIFLMEIIAAILFFSLAGALCLNLFAKSHQMNEDTRNLNMAASQVRNVTELLKNAFSPTSSIQTAEDALLEGSILEAYPDAIIEEEKALIYYNENWEHSSPEYGIYCMEITKAGLEENNIQCYQVHVMNISDKENLIYAFDLKLHIPYRR